MNDQTVVIVGGASGLGLETAKLMVKRGSNTIGLIDRNEQQLALAAESLRGLGANVATAVGDISRRDSAHGAFQCIVEALGRVHCLVNSAAIYPRKDVFDITDDEWDLENAVNIKGTYT